LRNKINALESVKVTQEQFIKDADSLRSQAQVRDALVRDNLSSVVVQNVANDVVEDPLVSLSRTAASELRRARNETSSAKHDSEMMELRLANVTRELEAKVEAFSAQDYTVHQLRAQLAQLDAELTNARKYQVDTTDDRRKLQAKISDLEAANDGLIARLSSNIPLSDFHQRESEWMSTSDGLRADLQRVRAELDRTRQHLDEVNIKTQTLIVESPSRDLVRLSQENEAQRLHISSLESQIVQQHSRDIGDEQHTAELIARLDDQAATTKSVARQRNAAVEEQSRIIEEYTATLEAVFKERHELIERNRELLLQQQESQGMSSPERASYEARTRNYEEQLRFANDRINELRYQVDSLRQNEADRQLQRQLTNVQTELESERAQFQGTLTGLKSELKRRDSSLSEATSRLVALETELHSRGSDRSEADRQRLLQYETEISDLRSRLASVTHDRDMLQIRVQQLESSAANASNLSLINNELARTVKSLEEERHALSTRVSDLNARLDLAQKERAELVLRMTA